jgi:hypothetical protein
MSKHVSELFEPSIWSEVAGFEDLTDITYHKHVSLGVVRIAFNRPEVRNAFRPQTVDELAKALTHAQGLTAVGGHSHLVETRRFVVVLVMSMGITAQVVYTFLKFKDLLGLCQR